MGGARNLKPGEQRGARAKHGAIFFVWGQMSTLFSCRVHQKCSGVQRQIEPLVKRGKEGASTPEAETLFLAF